MNDTHFLLASFTAPLIFSYLTGATTIGSGFQYLDNSAFENSGNSTEEGDGSKDSSKEPDDVGKSNGDTDIDNQHKGGGEKK
jgi:hypothetical protein